MYLTYVHTCFAVPFCSSRDPYGWTAVHHASFKGHLSLVKFIFQTGQVEVNCQDFFNCTPLHRSCSGGNPDTTEFLLQKGASHEARSCSGQTPLHLATANGHLGTARVLLQHLASPNPQDFHKWTPLHWAVFGGWGDVAELLLDNGADVEGGRGVGMSPLQLAVLVGNEAGVRLLLHRGADANTRGPNGRTALHLCACSGGKKVRVWLILKMYYWDIFSCICSCIFSIYFGGFSKTWGSKGALRVWRGGCGKLKTNK